MVLTVTPRRAGLTLQQPLLDLTVFPAWRFGRLTAESAAALPRHSRSRDPFRSRSSVALCRAQGAGDRRRQS